MSENMKFMGNIAHSTLISIEEEGDLQETDWLEFSLVATFDNDKDVDSNFGGAFEQSGVAHPFSADLFVIEPSLKEYRERLGEDGILKMLCQFNRKTNNANADFEYKDPNRWQVTPNNLDQIVEDLRPNLF